MAFIILSHLGAMDVVKNLDLDRFMGKWHVIANIPNFFEKNCIDSYDIYKKNDNGYIDIEYHATRNGRPVLYRQKGEVIDEINKSEWKLRLTKPYIPIIRLPYKVIILDDSYEYMVIGYPKNKLGWVMSRKKSIEDAIYQDIMNRLENEFGYKRNQFEMVLQTEK